MSQTTYEEVLEILSEIEKNSKMEEQNNDVVSKKHNTQEGTQKGQSPAPSPDETSLENPGIENPEKTPGKLLAEEPPKKQKKKGGDKEISVPGKPKPPVPGKEGQPQQQDIPKPDLTPPPALSPAPAPAMPLAPLAPADSKANIKLEQFATEIKLMKDSISNFEEKINSYAERIGEIRGLVMERENTLRDALISVKKINEVVSELEPMKIIMDKRKMNTELTIMKSKVDEYQNLIKSLDKKFSAIKDTLDAVTDVKTILELGKEVGKKLLHMEKMDKKMERIGTRVENLHIDISQKADRLPVIFGKIEKLDALSLEIMKILDDNKIRMDNFLVDKDLDPIKEEINRIYAKMDEVIEKTSKKELTQTQIDELNTFLKVLENHKSGLESTMSIVEEQYREAMISEGTYNELIKKSTNKRKALGMLISETKTMLKQRKAEESRIKELFLLLRKATRVE